MWSGLWQMLLDLACAALSASVGIEELLDKALLTTAVAGLVVGMIFLGESKTESKPTLYPLRGLSGARPAPP